MHPVKSPPGYIGMYCVSSPSQQSYVFAMCAILKPGNGSEWPGGGLFLPTEHVHPQPPVRYFTCYHRVSGGGGGTPEICLRDGTKRAPCTKCRVMLRCLELRVWSLLHTFIITQRRKQYSAHNVHQYNNSLVLLFAKPQMAQHGEGLRET